MEDSNSVDGEVWLPGTFFSTKHVSLQHDLDHVTTTLCSQVIFECPSSFNLNQPKQDQLRATRGKKKHGGLFIQMLIFGPWLVDKTFRINVLSLFLFSTRRFFMLCLGCFETKGCVQDVEDTK